MNTVIVNHVPNEAKHFQAYVRLPGPEKLLLRLLALIGIPIPQQDLQRCLLKVDFLVAEQKSSGSLMQAMLATLQQHQLIDKNACLFKDLLHLVTLEALGCPHGKQMVKAIRKTLFPSLKTTWNVQEWQARLTTRLLVYLQDETSLTQYTTVFRHRFSEENFIGTPFVEEHLSLEWLTKKPLNTQYCIFSNKYALALSAGKRLPELDAQARYYAAKTDRASAQLRYLACTYLLLTGQLVAFDGVFKSLVDFEISDCLLQGTRAFLGGNLSEASASYQLALHTTRQAQKTKIVFYADVHGLLFLLLRLCLKDSLSAIREDLNWVLQRNFSDKDAFKAFNALLLLLEERDAQAKTNLQALSNSSHDPRVWGVLALAQHWILEVIPPDRSTQLITMFEYFKLNYPIAAHFIAEILSEQLASETEKNKFRTYAQAYPLRLLEKMQLESQWERKLDRLEKLLTADRERPSEDQQKRLIWYVDVKSLEIRMGLEQRKKNGDWYAREASANRASQDTTLKEEIATSQDRKILQLYDDAQRNYTYAPIKQAVLEALIGHPRVYDLKQKNLRLDLVSGQAQLLVKQTGAQFVLKLSPYASSPTLLLEPETPTRYQVISFSADLVKIAGILTQDGLRLPLQAKDKILALLQNVSPNLVVNSDLDLVDIPQVESDDTLCVALCPLSEVGDGLKVSLWVRPFGTEGPAYPAARGMEQVVTTIDDQRKRAIRNLEKEDGSKKNLIANSHVLQLVGVDADEWIIDDLEQCLELMTELEEYQKTNSIRLEWPEGKKIILIPPASSKKFSVRIERQNDWFALDGELSIDDGQVIGMHTLLDLLDTSRGRFITLEPGKFLALSEHFAKQLRLIKGMSDGHHARVHPLAAGALDDILTDMNSVEVDLAWKTQVVKFRGAKCYTPQLPSTLQAELRDYQQDGFVWLSRLAYWGAGACLADDMGLGKTVQALALLLARASEGPALVVAPTSVCHNWVAEAKRFAPTLNLHTLSPTERGVLIENLGPMDVLVTSYGLLQRESDVFIAKPWHTLVLDEAQAVKNAFTQRSQVVMQLLAAFKLILSGTPIENHLGELWNLFRFINPGLLGSWESFQKKFMFHIERGTDPNALPLLKKLVQPFILRRLKSTVLKELPPRTEQTILIEPAVEEVAFYEALRQKALKALTDLKGPPGQRRIHILAEITRLRRACCHPQLVYPEAEVASGKLKALQRLVQDLLENGHKVLVFSQFVGYLHYVRRLLDEMRVRYQYLDGSTPAKQRKIAVDAFQTGEGELFLLSLKAGGTGLNLTAADYVIHLDPWWNPAVEDQASDRAHRIGQDKPVTIYRLIMKNTIEEKIVKLHQTKRGLADELLSESDVSGKLSEKVLLGLLQKASVGGF